MLDLLHYKVAAVVNRIFGRQQLRAVPMLRSVMLLRFFLLETRISGTFDEIITA
jgi:hypothetical protein